MKILSYKMNLDRLGITASTLCAIHCAALPFLITVLPMWGLDFLADEKIEGLMIVFSLLIGTWSLGLTYRSQHRNLFPLFILLLGFAEIAAGHFLVAEQWEAVVVPLGGFTVAAAHFVNMKLAKNCSVNHKHH